MKKSIFFAFLLMLMISVLGYLIYDSKIQRDNFTIINKKVKNITLLNMEFDLYIQNPLSYDNFDIIQRKITQFKNDLDEIRSNHILHKIKNQDLTQRLYILKKTTQEKFELMEKVKAHRAILNNSFRLIQKLYQFDLSPQFNSLYSTLLTTQLNPEIDLNQTLKKTLDLVSSNKYEKNFLKHAKIVLQYQLKFQKITLLLEKLHSKEKLDHFVTNYQKLTQDKIQRAYLSTIVLFGLLVLMITLNLVFAYRLIQSNQKLSRFRKTVENSDNIVVITNNHEIITYVNDAFTKTTGYSYEEAVGQKPSILKSGKQSDLFYAELKNTIHQGKKWSGEFVNINKFDELSYEKASITPVFDDDGNIIEFIAIKLDITNEVLAKQHLKEKEELLIQQSKMASMGEMLGNIAHQWRQPLSAITALSSGSKLQKELGLLSDQDFINNMDSIGQTTQHLSQTIDDFRNFFKPTKNKVIFNIEKSYRKTLQLLKSEFTAKEIIIIEDIEDVEVHGLDTEFIQVMMNILNNAHDALIKSKHQKRLIFITIYAKDNTAIVEIKDNAGGIPDNIINKVFEPYFTTKHQAQGTGIGLYMSQEMITKHMNGTLIVKNAHYAYEEDSYTGAQFTITLPLT